MNEESAKKILFASVKNLLQMYGEISIKELQEEVINLSLFHILRKRKGDQWADIKAMDDAFAESELDIYRITRLFANAALELFPNHYGVKDAIAATEAVKESAFEMETWDHVQNYFFTKHKKEKELIVMKRWEFCSLEMKKFKKNELIQTANSSTKIIVEFIEHTKLRLSIPDLFENELAEYLHSEDYYNYVYRSLSNSLDTYIIHFRQQPFEPIKISVINEKEGELMEFH